MDNLVLKKKDLAILRFIILSDIGNAIIASQDPEHAPFTTKELNEFLVLVGLTDHLGLVDLFN